MANNCFSVVSFGLITIRGRGLPTTSRDIRHTFLLSIVILLPHVHMFRLYFTAFSTSETCNLLLPQHTKLSRQCFALKSAKSAEFIFTNYRNELRRFCIWQMFSNSRKKASSGIGKFVDVFWRLYKMNCKIKHKYFNI